VEAYRQANREAAKLANRTCYNRASKLMAKAMVRAAIIEERKKLRGENEELVEAVIMELSAVALSRVGNVLRLRRSGRGKNERVAMSVEDYEALTPVDRAAIRRVRYRTYERHGKEYIEIECEMHDKVRPLELLTKILGMQQQVESERVPIMLNIQMPLPAGAIPPADMVPPSLQGKTP